MRWTRLARSDASLCERVASYADKSGGPDACWPFRGHLVKGYGQFTYKRRKVKAHRAAWECANGPIPLGIQVCHECDNPPCMNPKHLFLGTVADNNADKVAKGRQTRFLGQSNPFAKLTETDVRAIRCDSRSQSKIAAAYGVRQGLVSMIKNGKAWAHVR